MAHQNADQAREVASGLVDSGAADEIEVSIDSVAESFVRFADSGPTQSADRERHVLAVRARLRSDDGWREARATCDGLGAAATRGALERAVELAKVAPPNPELLPLESRDDDVVDQCAVDDATLEHGFDAKAEWVREALGACASQELKPAGLAVTSGMSRCVVNTAGRSVFGERSRASLSLTASGADGKGGSGFADGIARCVGELDPQAIFERAVGKAVMNREPRSVPAGDYTVLLEPNAVSSILLFAAYQGFGAQDVQEEASFLCGRIGKRVFPESLTISDDANNGHYSGFAFDGEGATKQRVDLVKAGILTGPVSDADWARRLGGVNTGHAGPKPNTDGPKPSNLVVHAGNSSTDELIAGIERGLLVTQFHYTNLIDPRDLMLTGMTRNGTFLIEGGEIVGAVKNLRFTESLVNAFGNISGIGQELEVAGALFDGEVVCPSLRIDDFRFTSTTDF